MLFIIKSEEGRATSNQGNIGIEYSESSIRFWSLYGQMVFSGFSLYSSSSVLTLAKVMPNVPSR